VDALKGEELPEPYRRLLVHSNDMTPTLEAFHAQPLQITVLGRERDAGTYLREVLLLPAVNGGPVEYGVIRIRLNQLPTAARRIVLEEERPLGNILQTEAIPHLSWPQSYFRVEADTHLNHVLGLLQPGTLYGRRNLLLTASRRLLAEVIEVLPPAPTNEDFKS
jgi:chorismate-pyruvate lyase